MPPSLPPGEVRAVPGRGEIFVRRAGRVGAPAVVLVHGWMATADLNFHPVFEELAGRYDVIAPDLRGHGRSLYPDQFTLEDAADDVAALLGDLGVARAVIVGYSLGSAVTQMLVARHPDLVSGVVLGASEVAPATRRRQKAYVRIGGWLGSLHRLSSGRWFPDRLFDKAVREAGDERLRGWVVCELERGHAGSLRAAGRALARFDGRPIAAAADLPAAVLVNRRDRLVPPRRQEELADAWGATAHRLDADHDAPVAQPDAFRRVFVGAIDDVIARVAAGTPAAVSA